VIPIAMICLFVVALAGPLGWIIPVLGCACVSGYGLWRTEHHR
jgi:uncharacterized membrane protein YecN with MAPEG domain